MDTYELLLVSELDQEVQLEGLELDPVFELAGSRLDLEDELLVEA